MTYIGWKEIITLLLVPIAVGVMLSVIIESAWSTEAPAFLETPSHDDLYRSKGGVNVFGYRFGGDVEEIPVLERHPKLKGVDPDLVRAVDKASRHVSLIVFSGCRSVKKQHKFYLEGKSQIGKHNIEKSRHVACKAVDIVFKKKKKAIWSREQALATLNFVHGVGIGLDIKCLRNGSSWTGDLAVDDNRFDDFFHLEIKRGCKR